MTLRTHAQQRVVQGTVLHGNSPRLLRIDEIDVEAPLQGNIIYLRNKDVPGVIGKVGTILGEHGVNIANFSLGRGEDAKEPREASEVWESSCGQHWPTAIGGSFNAISVVQLYMLQP